MAGSVIDDPFEELRTSKGYEEIDDQGDPVVMILGHKNVRRCAHNYKNFQSGAKPGRIVVPSEVDIRDTRQIPFEVDPPEHTEYRALVEDWFRRPLEEDYKNELKKLVDDCIDFALSKNEVEVVEDLALPLQSRALTLLLNIPLTEAETWISWGTHVFRSETSKLDKSKANILYDYIDQQIEQTIKHPDDSLYHHLLTADYQNRKLTKEEVKGVMILTFAGGRDTVINYITNTIAYLADHPASLSLLKKMPTVVNTATEELVRYFSPLTHMGRVATESTSVCEHAIQQNSRISLCWASANRDETVFEHPNEVILDRKKNPHVAFGFSHHKCLGASHARQLMKVLLTSLSEKIESIAVSKQSENIEEWGSVHRKVGYHSLVASFHPASL